MDHALIMADARIIIVGAGPAGIRAAERLVAAGLRPLLLDEGQRDGGQIYRRQPEGFTRSAEALYGTEAARAEAIHTTFDRLKPQIDYRPRHLAWNIADGHVHALVDGESVAYPFDRVIIAAGATDRLLPVKGWQHAGVYSLGGAQIALKAQACAIGQAVVFMGTGPLLQLVALQYHKAGARVVALLDTTPFHKQVLALPKLAARPDVLLKGLKLVAGLAAARIPIHRGVTPLEIHGEARRASPGLPCGSPPGKPVTSRRMRWASAITSGRKPSWRTWPAALLAMIPKRASSGPRSIRMAAPRYPASTLRGMARGPRALTAPRFPGRWRPSRPGGSRPCRAGSRTGRAAAAPRGHGTVPQRHCRRLSLAGASRGGVAG